MSSVPSPSTSRSNLNSIFNAALTAYKKKTGKNITSHPLATELQSCDSPDAILAVLRRQIPTPDQSQSGKNILKMPYSNCQCPLHPFRHTWRGCWSSDYRSVIPVENLCSNIFLPGILASKSNIYW